MARLVLERVGIDGVEAEPPSRRRLAQFLGIVELVPGKMQGNRRGRPRQLLYDRTVVEFVEDVARLAGPGKAGEARAARADAPGRQRDAEGGDLLRDRFGLEAPARQHAPQVIVILDQSGGGLFVGLGDETGVDGEAHGRCSSTGWPRLEPS